MHTNAHLQKLGELRELVCWAAETIGCCNVWLARLLLVSLCFLHTHGHTHPHKIGCGGGRRNKLSGCGRLSLMLRSHAYPHPHKWYMGVHIATSYQSFHVHNYIHTHTHTHAQVHGCTHCYWLPKIVSCAQLHTHTQAVNGCAANSSDNAFLATHGQLRQCIFSHTWTAQTMHL